MTDFCIQYIEWGVQYAHYWGFFIVFVLMTIEGSFIPFPSEVVLIPAGFLAYREELLFESAIPDLVMVIILGTAGAVLGACINYFLALKVGRPVLYRYGKYFLLSPSVISRAEEIFNRYGDVTTFVCRFLPAIRQLISIPAGLSRMNFARFMMFTSLGSCIWSAILALTGYYFATLASDMSYSELVHTGAHAIKNHFPLLLMSLCGVVVIYIIVHRKIMKPAAAKQMD